MPIGIAGKSMDELVEEQKRLDKCADGTFPGIMTETPKTADVEGSSYSAFKTKCDTIPKYAKAVYEYAMKRDIPYSVYGRKAMRVQALSGKIFTALDRGRVLAQIKLEDK